MVQVGISIILLLQTKTNKTILLHVENTKFDQNYTNQFLIVALKAHRAKITKKIEMKREQN